MNKKGQAVFVTAMIGVVVIILALALAFPVKESISNARGNSTGDFTGLNCTQTTISDFDKGACLISDITLPYFIGGLLFIGGAIIGYRLYYE